MSLRRPSSPMFLRQFKARLALCGLLHWQNVLLRFLKHFDGLECMVDDDRDGPRAAVLRMLRKLNASDAQPSNPEFATLLAHLPFLEYRVRRTTSPLRTFATAELWQPLQQQPLCLWRKGFAIGAYHASAPVAPTDTIAQELLGRLSRSSATAPHAWN